MCRDSKRIVVVMLILIFSVLLFVGCTESTQSLELENLKLKSKYQDVNDEMWVKITDNYLKDIQLFYEVYQTKDEESIKRSYDLISNKMGFIRDKITEVGNKDLQLMGSVELNTSKNVLEYSKDALELGIDIVNEMFEVTSSAARDSISNKGNEKKLTDDELDFLNEIEAKIIKFSEKYYE